MADKVCATCGARLPEAAAFCTQCGGRELRLDPAMTQVQDPGIVPDLPTVPVVASDPVTSVSDFSAPPPPSGWAPPGPPAAAPPAAPPPNADWSQVAPTMAQVPTAQVPTAQVPTAQAPPAPVAPVQAPTAMQPPTMAWPSATPQTAPAPLNPAPAKTGGGGRFGAAIALLGGAAAIVGVFLEWMKVTPSGAEAVAFSGWNLTDDAKIVAALGAIAVVGSVVVLGGSARSVMRVLVALAGVAMIGVGAFDTYDILQRLPDALKDAGVSGVEIAAPGIGLILVLAGGAVALLGALAMTGGKKPPTGVASN